METKNNRTKTLQLVICALFAAIMAVCAQVALPLPTNVPITLHTFGVAVCAAVGGSIIGTVSTSVYVLLGAVGLPVFSMMRGGLGVLIGPTGGFIVGFIPFAFFCGIQGRNFAVRMALSTVGLFICYLCGAVQYALIAQIGFIESIAAVVLPFMVKDVLSVVAAQLMAIPIRKAVTSYGVIK